MLRQTATVGVVGLVAGLAGAVGLSRLVASRLYGVSPLDQTSVLLAGLTLFAVVLVASAVPAHRATRVDPMDVLRCE